MQIQLKQYEIEQALRQYISSQGIVLSDKNVNIQFTAGRKSSGLLADITIDDWPAASEFPVLDGSTQGVKPSLTVVAPIAEGPPVTEGGDREVPADTATAVAPKASTVSLFG